MNFHDPLDVIRMDNGSNRLVLYFFKAVSEHFSIPFIGILDTASFPLLAHYSIPIDSDRGPGRGNGQNDRRGGHEAHIPFHGPSSRKAMTGVHIS